jgi:murein hydrolase activator
MLQWNSTQGAAGVPFGWRLLALPLLVLLCMPLCIGQARKDLEKKRDALDKQINTTKALIEQARKEQRSAQQQVLLLGDQIERRNELIATMSTELGSVEREVEENEARVAELQQDLLKLREHYAQMVQFAYRNRSGLDRLSYIFAADDFAQAMKRARYLDQIAENRRQQAARIMAARTELEAKLEDLRAQSRRKADLLGLQVNEKRRLAEDLDEKESALAGLRKEEGQLRDRAKKQDKQKADLDNAIRKAIETEMRAEAAKAARSTGSAAKGTLALTPEAKALADDMERNKGKLPWPVARGVITSRFGKQPHPVLKGIQIENNGVDITTEKGASVKAVFRGEVSSVIVIAGAGKAVVLSHGSYRTVYSNLRDVSVTKGQKVETGQVLGTVLSEEGTSTAHLEVWKIASDGLGKQDPSTWLLRP